MQFSAGSHYLGNNHSFFRVWAPQASTVELRIVYPRERLVPLVNAEQGYFQMQVADAAPETRRRHGTTTRDIPAERFVVFCQNHDQVGNRMLGERLSQLVSFEALKLAAGAVLLSLSFPCSSWAKIRRRSALSIFHQPQRPHVGGSGAQGTTGRVRRFWLASGASGPSRRNNFLVCQTESPTARRRTIPYAFAILPGAHSFAKGTRTTGAVE